jgi:hypothetical protein
VAAVGRAHLFPDLVRARVVAAGSLAGGGGGGKRGNPIPRLGLVRLRWIETRPGTIPRRDRVDLALSPNPRYPHSTFPYTR